MNSTGRNIKRLRLSRGMTQQKLADVVGAKNYTTITKWESGDNSPQGKDLITLSKYFNVSVDSILGITEEVGTEQSTKEFDYNYFPTAISAGLPFEVDGMTESEKISVPNSLMGRWARDEDVYLTKIYGDSMDKVMRDGSIIAIKPIPKEGLKDGDIVVFSDSYEYSVKHYYKHDDKLVFRPNSNNASHHEQHYKTTDNIEIHGKVVMWIVTTD